MIIMILCYDLQWQDNAIRTFKGGKTAKKILTKRTGVQNKELFLCGVKRRKVGLEFFLLFFFVRGKTVLVAILNSII